MQPLGILLQQSIGDVVNLLLGSGRDQCSTNLQLYGLDSHWGLRSSLLGDEELMIVPALAALWG